MVALSAWHIYPDMIYFGASKNQQGTEVTMNDPLIYPGGVLSLGISSTAHEEGSGVSWSLSLAHHRFYGPPIQKQGQIETHGGRVSFPEFQQVLFGAILATWHVPKWDIDAAMCLLVELVDYLSPERPEHPDSRGSWFAMIRDPVLAYKQCPEDVTIFLRLGLRRKNFVSLRYDSLPLFGLMDISRVLPTLKGSEERIEFLRFGVREDEIFKNKEVLIAYSTSQGNGMHYATAYPKHCGLTIPDEALSQLKDSRRNYQVPKHYRWVSSPKTYPKLRDEVVKATGTRQFVQYKRSIGLRCKGNLRSSFYHVLGEPEYAAVYIKQDQPQTIDMKLQLYPISVQHIRWSLQHELFDYDSLHSAIINLQSVVIETLKLAGCVSKIYRPLSGKGATINCRIFDGPFRIRKAFNTINVIAGCEIGYDILGNSNMNRAVALSSGDSIYIPQWVS